MCLATVRAVQAAYSGISCEQPTASSSSGLSCSKVSVIDCVSGVGGDSCVCVCVCVCVYRDTNSWWFSEPVWWVFSLEWTCFDSVCGVSSSGTLLNDDTVSGVAKVSFFILKLLNFWAKTSDFLKQWSGCSVVPPVVRCQMVFQRNARLCRHNGRGIMVVVTSCALCDSYNEPTNLHDGRLSLSWPTCIQSKPSYLVSTFKVFQVRCFLRLSCPNFVWYFIPACYIPRPYCCNLSWFAYPNNICHGLD